MEKTRLEMDFIDESNKKVRLSLDEPREDVTEGEIKAAMEAVIAHNIFISNDGDLIGIDGARIVRTTVSEMEV